MKTEFSAGQVKIDGKKYRCAYSLRPDGICMSGEGLPPLGGEPVREEYGEEAYEYEFFPCEHAQFEEVFAAWWETENRQLDRMIEAAQKKVWRAQREVEILEEEKRWLNSFRR